MEYRGGILIANSDIQHHGILGQKWGRRNGPPYPLGSDEHSISEKKAGWKKSIKRLNKKSEKLINKDDERIKNLANKILSNKSDSPNYSNSAGTYMSYDEDVKEFNSYLKDEHTIKGGTEISRLTNQKETLDNKIKYVALMKRDKVDYLQSLSLLKDEDHPILYHDTYKFKKDIKFANADEVWTYLLDNYGNKKQQEAYKFKREVEKKGLTLDSYLMTNLESHRGSLNRKELKDAKQLVKVANEMDRIGGWKKILYDDKKVSNNVMKYFKKQGYDAIIDIEDTRTWGVAPLIILDPVNSMEFSHSKHY